LPETSSRIIEHGLSAKLDELSLVVSSEKKEFADEYKRLQEFWYQRDML
jgi:hypothetical protein